MQQGEDRALVTPQEWEKGSEHIRGNRRKWEEIGGPISSIPKGKVGVPVMPVE